MLFRYPLSDSQKAGVKVTGEQLIDGVETWYFTGRCRGTMALVRMPRVLWAENSEHRNKRWECWIRVQSKPWWLPWFVLDWGFREALR